MEHKTGKSLILIVDDTPINIQVLAEALRVDYRVKVAASGAAAFEVIAKQGAPDLILLDVMMPGMDGYEVCRRLKESPVTKNVPVIFVTAKTDLVDEEQGLRLGAVDYIAKPFHLPIVIARIGNQISLKRKTDLLESLAMLDGLTSIPNRRRFDEALEAEWKRARRNGLPLALIMADVDYFKNFNDHYGHGAGDTCLKKVAAALVEAADRPADLVARYGGEEFVALLPETDLRGAKLFAERFRSGVESLQIPHQYSAASPWVTISIGCAFEFPARDEGAEGLLEAADRNLYVAKEAGRNRIHGSGTHE
jgi:diguanylate cyclase (GGDEF)-like protein